MATFQYRAKDRKGGLIQGTMDGDSETFVVQRLQTMGYFPFDIVDTSPKKAAGLFSELTKKRITLNDITTFTRQLADLLNAGVPLVKALSVIESQTANESLANIVKQVRLDVEKGDNLAQALGHHPRQFPQLYTSMVRAGEAGGLLYEVLERLADFYETENEVKGKVLSALAYPVIIVLVGLVVVFILMTVVIPKIVTIYEDMGSSLPLITQVLISTSDFMAAWWWLILIGIVAGIVSFRQYARTEKGQLTLHGLYLRIPVLGGILIKREVARFSRTFGALLHNGVSILMALDIVADVLDNAVVRREIRALPEAVSKGSGVAQALEGSKAFPDTVINMMSVGEQTGRLDEVLMKIARSFEMEVDRNLRTAMSLIEPLIILVIAVFVGGIALAMFLPIFYLDPTSV